MLSNIINDIIHGHQLSREDAVQILLEADTEALCGGAEKIRRHYCGNKMNLCSIINGKSGRCSEDCKYCAQSVHNPTEIN